MINSLFAPKVHLGFDCTKVKSVATTHWIMGSLTFTDKSLKKVCAILKVDYTRKEKFPSIPGYHPKLDLSPLPGEENNLLYQNQVVMVELMVQIGSFDT